jgi:Tol biopolymer transport system component
VFRPEKSSARGIAIHFRHLYTDQMQSQRFITAFIVRLGMRLLLPCLIGIGLFTWAGHGTSRRVIAFVTITDDKLPKLHLMDIQRRLTRQISSSPVFSCCPLWSPDGTQIVFTGNENHAFVVNVYDGETRPLTPDWAGWVMNWTADGRQVILRTMAASNGSLYRVDTDGKNFGLLAQGASNSLFLPLLSPDSRFAFDAIRLLDSNDWKVFRLNLADGTDHLLINENYDGSQILAISPDGQRLAYALTQRREVILMDADGKNLQPVATTEDILQMVWSPDNQRILFLAQDPAGVQEVYVTDADGQNRHDLVIKGTFASMSDFSWSPDGAQIGFVGTEKIKGKPDLYVMDADGENLQQLTSNPENDLYPTWQPGM